MKVIIVESGPFRTDFLGRSIATAARQIDAYAETSGKLRDYRRPNGTHQVGDPAKAIAVILRAVDAQEPLVHLPFGPIAHGIAERELDAFRADIAAWCDLAIATEFDPRTEEMPMITMFVTCVGNADTRSNRAHWIDTHLPLVRECWGPYGLESVGGLLPEGGGADLIAIAPCVFGDGGGAGIAGDSARDG